MPSKFYLYDDGYLMGYYQRGYYTGESYVVQGEKFAMVAELPESAKAYSTRKRAERACKALSFCGNVFQVVEVAE